MFGVSKTSYVPADVRGMKQLDRKKFSCKLEVPVLRLPCEIVSKVLPICRPLLLKFDNLKPVQFIDDQIYSKCIFLDPKKFRTWNAISADLQKSLQQHDVSELNFGRRVIRLSYENFKYIDIFKAVLPEGENIISGFSQMGHLIHLNLRDNLLDYKKLIGQVLIDKIKNCRCVVIKTNIIDNTYRNFKMEVVAGEKDFLVTVKENNCLFQFDFSKVYWNSRLCKEHERIVSYLNPGDVLFDIFCGVGPFAIPAGKKKCKVFANDLNPDSYEWLKHNAKFNKLNMMFFKTYNMDGKDFICNNLKQYIINCCNGDEMLEVGAKICVTMNLPAIAVEFLKYFIGLIPDKELLEKFHYDLIVYVYCFAVGDNSENTAIQMVNDSIGIDVTPHIMEVFNVRNVAPNKEMMRVTLNIRKELLSYKIDHCEPPIKKRCIETNDG